MKKKILFVSLSFLMCALFTLHEYILNFYFEHAAWREALKFFLSVIPVIITCVGWKSCRDGFIKNIAVGLSFFCAGDVAISIDLLAGMAFYFTGNIWFIWTYFNYKKPAKICYACWILAFLIIDTVIILFADTMLIKICASLYIVSMTAMVASSFGTPLLLNLGSIIFGFSDLLIIRNAAFGISAFSHIISLGVYYIGVMIMARFSLYYKEKHLSSRAGELSS